MAIFISYNRQDRRFVDKLAVDLVKRGHNVWVDRWEMNVGDSLIDRIQSALVSSSAILIVLSKSSVSSEWCKKELNSGLVRELAEKQVIILPCVIDDCDIPLFLRDKLYADFRADYDEAVRQVDNSLLRITNHQQGRIESPDFHTDWAYDWKSGKKTGLWYFDWYFVDHGAALPYCVLTHCQIACNDVASAEFSRLEATERQTYIRDVFARVVDVTSRKKLKFHLTSAFEKYTTLVVAGDERREWLVEIASRRMGIDNGKDTLVHVDLTLERALAWMKEGL